MIEIRKKKKVNSNNDKLCIYCIARRCFVAFDYPSNRKAGVVIKRIRLPNSET